MYLIDIGNLSSFLEVCFAIYLAYLLSARQFIGALMHRDRNTFGLTREQAAHVASRISMDSQGDGTYLPMNDDEVELLENYLQREEENFTAIRQPSVENTLLEGERYSYIMLVVILALVFICGFLSGQEASFLIWFFAWLLLAPVAGAANELLKQIRETRSDLQINALAYQTRLLRLRKPMPPLQDSPK